MIIQDLPLNQDNYTFSLEKAKPPADGTAQEQTVFSAVTVKNRLSSLKSGFPSEPLDAKQSVSGQVPCFLSLGCSPRGNPLSSDSHEGVTLSPSHSYQDFFLSKEHKLPVLPPPLRKPLKYRLGAWLKAEQWVFFGVHTGPQRHAQLSFLHRSWPASQGLPWLAFVAFWSGEEQSQKPSKKCQTGKRSAGIGHFLPTEGHSQEPLWNLCHVQVFKHCVTSKIIFEESEDCRGVGQVLYSFCLSSDTCRYIP